MNSIADLINQKADNIFPTPTNNPTDDHFDNTNEDNLYNSPPLPTEDLSTDESNDLQKNQKQLLDSDMTDTESITSSNTTKEKPVDQSTIATLKKQLYSLKDQIESIIKTLDGEQKPLQKKILESETVSDYENIVEGVFDGEKMIGPDGKHYAVPANYASKSKLVEGDIMKLTIQQNGRFVFKQISPVVRKRSTGILQKDEDTDYWHIKIEDKKYKVLTASVTYYKGNIGDEVIILLPDNSESSWGAVENIIKKNI